MGARETERGLARGTGEGRERKAERRRRDAAWREQRAGEIRNGAMEE